MQLPTSLQWYSFVSTVMPLFVADFASTDADSTTKALDPLWKLSALEQHFSESRCAKALPMALTAYKEAGQQQQGDHDHYGEELHAAKVTAA